MIRPLAIAILACGVVITPMQALSFNTGSLFPTITYPEPTPEPVTRDTTQTER
ncbi:hypothetical protein ROA7450_01286 [Roseovarius albus]|uniref:Uncharacterized protein n=1 Tax=Roseovarius albus TaxID=1247867 RepID=A0A1X6YT35_9RHOB|nr:hypothetical protein [Roseovarius albus]SLN29954.1 hypothetical protein ROA7450_01286 [Roseovarius albus]